MIRLSDAALLAFTKLRTRKIRTIITVLVSALLFGILIALIIVTQGAFKSLASFSHEGLNDRYIVRAVKGMPLEQGLLSRKDLLDRAKELYDQTVTAKISVAKKLGIVYDPTTEMLPYNSFDGDPKNNHLNLSNLVTQQVLDEYYTTQPRVGLSQLIPYTTEYHPKSIFSSVDVRPSNGAIVLMNHGVEQYPDTIKAQDKLPQLSDNIFNLIRAPAEISQPFLLQSTTWAPPSGNIPIIVSRTNAEQLLGITPLPRNATTEVQLQRIKAVRDKSAGLVIDACYRNDISQQQIIDAVSVPNEIAKNSTSKAYQPAPLQYSLPAANSCSQAIVKSDTRTTVQKSLDSKQSQFNQQFGAIIVPSQQKIKFQVVGISPDPVDSTSSNTVNDLLVNLVGSSALPSTIIPQQLYDQLSTADKHKDILANYRFALFGPDMGVTSFAEFSNADDARRFVGEQSCFTSSNGICLPKNKLFNLSIFGSNSVALEELKDSTTNIIKISLLVATLVATIIMSGTVGRMIIDSRRETAVFRAVGFKRIDIVSVYTIYALFLSSYVSLLSLAIGITGSYIFDRQFWQFFTIKAKLSFGAADQSREFHFFTLDSPWIWVVGASVVLLGLISIFLPLTRNLRRNPIEDMRDE